MFRKVTNIKKLNLIANDIRQDIIRMLLEAGSGHSGGPLGMADVFTALYFNILKHDPKKPDWIERDYVVLSNGHICPVLYATLAHAGYFPKKELMTLRKLGSRLQGHPHRTALPGLETTSGPLGSGLSQAAGITYGLQMDNKKNRVFCLMSDGEFNEGQTWEALLFVGKNKLHRLTAIIDRNNIQIDGHTEDIMPLEPLREKLESFNWNVIEVDAHNIPEVIDVCNQASAVFEKPTIIIAHSIPGKGVSFMEEEPEWHGKPPNEEQAKEALRQLQKWRKRLMQDGVR